MTATGQPVPELAQDLGINETTLASGVSRAKRAREGHTGGQRPSTASRTPSPATPCTWVSRACLPTLRRRRVPRARRRSHRRADGKRSTASATTTAQETLPQDHRRIHAKPALTPTRNITTPQPAHGSTTNRCNGVTEFSRMLWQHMPPPRDRIASLVERCRSGCPGGPGQATGVPEQTTDLPDGQRDRIAAAGRMQRIGKPVGAGAGEPGS